MRRRGWIGGIRVDEVEVSVIVCTYDRAHRVGQVLEDLLAQETPDDLRWEIVVVDNNSKDRTPEILDAYVKRYPGRIRHLFESRQGKSFALNLALDSAEGRFLLFTDDDVRVDADWVACTVEFLSRHPKVLGVGGRVVPLFPSDAKIGLEPEEVDRYFRFDFGEEPLRLDENPFGANMAYRREAFTRYGRFRTDLGPTGADPAGLGEDSEFGRRILDDGGELWYLPTSRVGHPVQLEELTPQHLDRWHFEYGRSLVRRTGIPQPMRQLFSVPRFLLRRWAEAWLAWILAPSPRIRRHRHWELEKVRGQVHEARRLQISRESTGVTHDEGLGHRS